MRQEKQFSIFFVFFFLLFAGVPAAGFGAATISGTVTIDGGPPGASEIDIQLLTKESWTYSGCVAESASSSPSYDESTGNYTFSGIAAGDYYLKVSPTGGTNLVAEWATGVNSNSVEDCTAAVPVTIADGDSLTGYNFQLEPGGTVSGILREDGTTTPLEGISVDVYLQYDTDNGCSGRNMHYKGTDSQNDGSFAITGLPLDTPFFVAADSRGSVNYVKEWSVSSTASDVNCEQAFSFSTSTASPTVTADFALDPGSIISGIVKDTDGNLIQSSHFSLAATSDIYSPCDALADKSWEPVDNSAADGTFTIRGIAPGTYTLRTLPADYLYLPEYWADPQSVSSCLQAEIITVSSSGEVHSGKDFQIGLGATVTGTITDNSTGAPITGVNVNLISRGPCGTRSNQLSGTGSTDANGVYTISGLPEGDHFLTAYDPQRRYLNEGWNNVHDPAQETPITISSPGQVITDIDLQLDTPSSINGTIKEVGGSNLSSDDLANLIVRAYPDTGNPCELTDVTQGTVNSDGSYTIPFLDNGNYRVMVASNGNVNYMPAFSGGGVNSTPLCSDLALTTIQITSYGSTVSPIDLQMSPGATLQGTVSREDNEAVGGQDFIISLVGYDPGYSGDACSNNFRIGDVFAAAGGSYSISGLPPGQYSVYISTYPLFFSNLPDIVQEWAVGDSQDSTPDCSQAEIFTIPEDPSVTLSNRNFQVDFGGKVSGRVLEYGAESVNTEGYVVRFHPTCDTADYYYEAENSCAGYVSPTMEAGDYYVSLFDTDRQTFLGWASQTGEPVSNCAETGTVTVIQEQTLPDINFILDKDSMTLVPIYMLLLNSSGPQ